MKSRYRHFILCLLLFLGGFGQIHAQEPDSACGITTSEVTLDDGVIHYRQAGAGATVLLLHGLFAQKEQWDEVICLLAAEGYNAIAPDLPGYGQSTTFPITDYRLEQQVVRLRQFLDHLGILHLDIAGNSMGGAIAALFARAYPWQIRTLAFIGPPLGITDWGPSVKDAIFQGTNPFIPVEVAEFDLKLSLLFVHPPVVAEEIKRAAIQDFIARNRHYQQVWTIVSLYDRVLLPPRLSPWLPLFLLWGEEDKIFPIPDAPVLRPPFLRGKLIRLPHAGHLPHVENPVETVDHYLTFLRRPHWRRFHAGANVEAYR